MKTLTQKKQRQKQLADSKASVMKLTGMNELEYNSLQFELGCRFVELRIIDNELINDLLILPEFWGWWRNEWYLYQKEFVIDNKFFTPLNSCNQDNRNFFEGVMNDMLNDFAVFKGLEHLIKSF